MANTSTIDLVKPAGTDYALISTINGNMDKIDAEAAKERENFAGTYSTSSAYAVGAYCIYQGNLYRCTTAIGSGGEAWTAGHWTQVAVGNEITALNDQIAKVINNAEYTSGSGSKTITVPTGKMFCVLFRDDQGDYTAKKAIVFGINSNGTISFFYHETIGVTVSANNGVVTLTNSGGHGGFFSSFLLN